MGYSPYGNLVLSYEFYEDSSRTRINPSIFITLLYLIAPFYNKYFLMPPLLF